MGIPNTIKALPEQNRWENPYEYDNAFNSHSVFLGVNNKGLSYPPTHNTWFFPRADEKSDFKSYDDYMNENLDF